MQFCVTGQSISDSVCLNESFERFRLERERDLIELAARSHDRLGEARPEALQAAAARNADALRAHPGPS